MKHLRFLFGAVAGLAFAVAVGAQALATLQQQRDQISVSILVNVTPAPLGVRLTKRWPIALRMAMRERGSDSELVAQAQSAVRVQAVVTPNPNATLLYYNVADVIINQTAGTTATVPCAYTVTADKTGYTWQLDDGLSGDFASAFPGADLQNNTYLQAATPQPKSTPFVVYPHNNNAWYKFATGTGLKTYCVDLTLTIPATVAGGAYTTNAVYTIYY